MRPARYAVRPASTAHRMARAIATGSRAAASAVFIRIPSTPCSMVRHASDAVPTPASTTTGTLSRRLIVRTPNGFRSPSPLPIGEADGILGGVAPRGVREQKVPLRVEVIQDALLLRAVQVHTSDCDGDDLGAGRFDRP